MKKKIPPLLLVSLAVLLMAAASGPFQVFSIDGNGNVTVVQRTAANFTLGVLKVNGANVTGGGGTVDAGNVTAGTLISTVLGTNVTVANDGHLVTGAMLVSSTLAGTNDSSGHYVFGGGSAYVFADATTANLTINGQLAVLGPNYILMQNNYNGADANVKNQGNAYFQATSNISTAGMGFLGASNDSTAANRNKAMGGMFYVTAANGYYGNYGVGISTNPPLSPANTSIGKDATAPLTAWIGVVVEGGFNNATYTYPRYFEITANRDVIIAHDPKTPTQSMVYIPNANAAPYNYGKAEVIIQATDAWTLNTNNPGENGGAGAYLTLLNSGNVGGGIAMAGPNMNYAAYSPNQITFNNYAAGGVQIMAGNSTGNITWTTGGDGLNKQHARMFSTGNLSLGENTTLASDPGVLLLVSGNSNFTGNINTVNLVAHGNITTDSGGNISAANEVHAGGAIIAGGGTTKIESTLYVKTGTNAKSGSFTLSGGAATVNNTSLTANSIILFELQPGGESGVVSIHPFLSDATVGTSFTVSGAATDNSTYNYVIIEITP